jgi:DNA-binding Lrp family transcriptional regulator
VIREDPPTVELSQLERRLLNEFQRHLPLVPRPYLAMAEVLGVDEDEVLAMLGRLEACGALSRVGAVLRPNSVGASTLGAMAVPPEELEAVARAVSARPEVSHNYEREHRFNLWFVVCAEDQAARRRLLDEIEGETGYPVLDLPLLAEHHIDLGFELSWS